MSWKIEQNKRRQSELQSIKNVIDSDKARLRRIQVENNFEKLSLQSRIDEARIRARNDDFLRRQKDLNRLNNNSLSFPRKLSDIL